MSITFEKLSAEDQQKIDFMMEVEYVMQEIRENRMSMADGYEKLMLLLTESEIERILQILYNK